MGTRTKIRSAALASLVAMAAIGAAGFASASDQRVQPVRLAAGGEANSRFVPLGIGKSFVIDLPVDIKDVLVAEPRIANAVVRSARRAYIIGVTVGQTNVFFFDAEGKQIAGFDIAVTRDLNGIRGALKQALPEAELTVEGVNDGVVLAGSVASPSEAQQAYDIASRLVGDGTKVVNSIAVRGRDQVMLKVTVAEIQRDVIKQLGIDLNGSISYGVTSLNFNTANPFSAVGQQLSGSAITGSWNPSPGSVNATLRAMERAGVIRTLAEPNLTAISGEVATFLAGGEFPVPAGYTCSVDATTGRPLCQQQIEWKKFGVSLHFSPVVLSEGRISLKVLTEVSELSSDNALTLQPDDRARALTIPSIRTRRADTVVELPSGGSLAMAGMIQEQTKQAINGLPGLMQLPILGTLFKSRDYINRQTEMVILVTPYVVRSVARKDLSQPDDGYADTTDPQAVLLGRLNRIYGVSRKLDPRRMYHGKYGFILD